MEINISQQGNATIVRAGNRLDSNTSGAFQDQLTKLIESESVIIVDMSDFNYVSSAGLRVLLVAAKQSKAAGHKLALCGLVPVVHMIFDISGFLSIFPIFANTDEAIAAFS